MITAGASAPEVLVEQLVARLRELGAARVRSLEGISESVVFKLPRELVKKALVAGPRGSRSSLSMRTWSRLMPDSRNCFSRGIGPSARDG